MIYCIIDQYGIVYLEKEEYDAFMAQKKVDDLKEAIGFARRILAASLEINSAYKTNKRLYGRKMPIFSVDVEEMKRKGIDISCGSRELDIIATKLYPSIVYVGEVSPMGHELVSFKLVPTRMNWIRGWLMAIWDIIRGK